MFNMCLKMFIMFIFSSILMSLGLILTKKIFKNFSQKSPFECGFNPRSNSRLPFSLQFFLVAMIFVIFDVELILLFPYFSSFSDFWEVFSYILFVGFLVLLTVGLTMEWNQQMLNWVI